MVDLIQILITGIAQGMIYALVAFGYNITFSTSKMLNFSNGSFMMVGGVLSFVLSMTHAVPFIFMLLAVMLMMTALGVVVQQTAFLPAMKTKSSHSWILATLSMSIILQSGVEVFWGTEDVRVISPISSELIRWGQVNIYPQEILVIVTSIAIVVCIEVFKNKSLFGKAIMAVQEDKNTASLMGINQSFVILFSVILSSVVAGLAGILVAPLVLVSSTMGVVIGVKAYAVSIIGGLESGAGVLAGGLIIGISEALTARYVSSSYKDFTGFLILILILLLLPAGLFGKKAIKKL